MNFKLRKFWFLWLLLSLSLSATAYQPQFADEARSVPLRWKTNVIPIAVSTSFTKSQPNIKDSEEINEAIKRSLEAWEKVADIKFQIIWTDKQSVSSAGKNGDGVTLLTIAQTPENLLLFSGDGIETAARTRMFFNRRGIITEADIVLNPYAQFSTDGAIGTFDLQATITHEIGHLLGLEHSAVIGSTMFGHQSKNGIYSLPNFNPRTLADDDIAGIRGIYGANADAENCCGAITGKLSPAKEKPAGNYQIWLEEFETGRVIAGVLSNADGKFGLSGLPEGKYRVFAQPAENEQLSAVELENIEISKNKTNIFNRTFEQNAKNFDFQLIGFNGQISNVGVPVNRGKSYLIYLAGKNLNLENMEIQTNSPFLKTNSKTLLKQEFGSEFSVYTIEINADAETPAGEYSLFIRSANGTLDQIIGGILVDDFINPWVHRVF